MPKRRLVEFNEFPSLRGGVHNIPQEPTVDLYAKLLMRDFSWAVDFANVSAKYSVVCQYRKSSFYFCSSCSMCLFNKIIMFIKISS